MSMYQYENMDECNICYEIASIKPCINQQCTLKICEECLDVYTINYNYTTCPQCNIDWPKINKNNSETIMAWLDNSDNCKFIVILIFISFLVTLILYSIATGNHK